MTEQAGTGTIDIEKAVKAVVEHVRRFTELFPSTDLRLEEFDFDSDRDRWIITMSIYDPVGFGRAYKTFSVDPRGHVESMRIRNPALKESA